MELQQQTQFDLFDPEFLIQLRRRRGKREGGGEFQKQAAGAAPGLINLISRAAPVTYDFVLKFSFMFYVWGESDKITPRRTASPAARPTPT
eukprot:gene8463-5939_t